MIKQTLYCDLCTEPMPDVPNRPDVTVGAMRVDVCINCTEKPISRLLEVGESIGNRGYNGNHAARKSDSRR